MYSDIVVDLECLRTKDDRMAPILSIGAVAFNINEQDSLDDLIADPTRQFYTIPNLQDQFDVGLLPDASTILWWMNDTSAQARQVFKESEKGSTHPLYAFQNFANWIKSHDATRLWGNGNTFDNMILRNAFNKYKVEMPIRWTCDMDMRTLKFAAGGMQTFSAPRGVAHNALDDALYETLVLQEAHRLIHS